jgi:hypothetical protein
MAHYGTRFQFQIMTQASVIAIEISGRANHGAALACEAAP